MGGWLEMKVLFITKAYVRIGKHGQFHVLNPFIEGVLIKNKYFDFLQYTTQCVKETAIYTEKGVVLITFFQTCLI